MKIKRCEKGAFAVIGKEGSTNDGEGFRDEQKLQSSTRRN